MQVALDCARGLGCLHEKGLVHGDFRASNVLLGRTDAVRAEAAEEQRGLRTLSALGRKLHMLVGDGGKG